jgi:hypothetical protein
MNELSYTEIPNAEKSDIGKICVMADGCNPLAIEDTIEDCLRVCLDCGMESADENGDPRPMTSEDCEKIAYLVTE